MATLISMLKPPPDGRELPPAQEHSRPDSGTPGPETTFSLVVRARGGDRSALDELCVRYLPRLRRWAHGRLPAWTRQAIDTEDLVQDTLTQVAGRIQSFEPRHEGAFQGYVRTALLNRIRDIARQYQRKGAQDPLDSEIAGHEHSPLDLAIGQETIDRYEAALERLRQEERDLVIARIEMGLPHAEIARMFDKPSVAAVHMALSRALVRLAEEMAHERKR